MKPSSDELDAAVAGGVLGAVEAERLRVFIDGRRLADAGGPGKLDRERVRFVRGFHDVFMSVGLTVLLLGLRYATVVVEPDAAAAAAYLAAAALSWGFAELFTMRQRLVLPSVVLALAVPAFVGHATFAALAGQGTKSFGLPVLLAVTAAATFAAAAFRLRFRLPFSSMLIGAGLVATTLELVALVSPAMLDAVWAQLLLAAGLASFALAMRFDMTDPARETLSADNGFWLHMLAAPLIVHSLLLWIAGPRIVQMGGWQAALVILVVLALAYVAVVVDRRALLMSGLLYLGGAVGVLIAKADIGLVPILALTLVIIGSFVTALGAVWRPTRRRALGVLPDGLRRYVPSAV